MLSNNPLSSSSIPQTIPISEKIDYILKYSQQNGEMARMQQQIVAAGQIPGPMKSFKFTNGVAQLIQSYATETTCAVLEEALMLAKHRNGKEITKEDIALVFGKFSF